jgi:hypothetical protein
MDDPVERHTTELKTNQEDAEDVMRNLQQNGWEVYHERVPLTGQAGYYCVRTVTCADGSEIKHAHSVRWNRFIDELIPVTIDCLYQTVLLSYLWRHVQHDDFEYFEYGDGDVGFVCYCNADVGRSEVLRVSDEFDHDLDERCAELIGELANG